MTARRALLVLCVAILAMSPAPTPSVASTAPSADSATLVLFWGDGCPHCEAEMEFLSRLVEEHPGLEVVSYEVWKDAGNRQIFVETLRSLGEEPAGVPTTVLDDRIWVGFSDSVASEIRAAVVAEMEGTEDPPPGGTVIELPILGEVDLGSTSLVTSTLLIALVDGFNPCSLWALSILLALVLRTGSRGRVLMVGMTFLTITAGMYALYIVGLYGVLTLAAHATWVRVSMALIALAFGLINLKDYFAFKRGPSLTIADSAKPGLYRRMRRLTDDRPLRSVLAGTGLLAVGVSILETPCTAGYPLLWTDLVSSQGVETAGAVALFALYMAVFLADELIVFGGAVATMRAAKLEERHGRVLKLVSGTLMISLALTLIFAPELMTDLAGVAITFGLAALAASVVLVATRVSGRRLP